MFGRFSDYGLRFLAMVSEKAQDRYRGLLFWEKYGLEATIDKRRTLYHWREQLKKGNDEIESLNEKSRTSRIRRKRRWPKEILAEIRRLRTAHPNLSKQKLYPFMKVFCDQRMLSCPKAEAIGRIIADAPDKMRSRPSKLRAMGRE